MSNACCILRRFSSVFPTTAKITLGQEEQEPRKRGLPFGVPDSGERMRGGGKLQRADERRNPDGHVRVGRVATPHRVEVSAKPQ